LRGCNGWRSQVSRNRRGIVTAGNTTAQMLPPVQIP
jgi:hypothetical protein